MRHEPSREAIEGAFDTLLQVRGAVLYAAVLQGVIFLAGMLVSALKPAVMFSALQLVTCRWALLLCRPVVRALLLCRPVWCSCSC